MAPPLKFSMMRTGRLEEKVAGGAMPERLEVESIRVKKAESTSPPPPETGSKARARIWVGVVRVSGGE
jgi:hypothetical protein